MEKPAHGRLTETEGRKFGLSVGMAFILLSAILIWRGHDLLARVLFGTGVGLVLAGLFVPARLGPVYRSWMGLALLMSRVTTPVFMGITFFLVITPIGIVMRMLGRDPMVRRPVDGSYWVTRGTGPGRRSNLERQF